MDDQKLEEIASAVQELKISLIGSHMVEGAIPRIEKRLQTLNGDCASAITRVGELEISAAIREERWKWLKWIVTLAAGAGGGGGAAGIWALVRSISG